jgi:hypothetical protein
MRSPGHAFNGGYSGLNCPTVYWLGRQIGSEGMMPKLASRSEGGAEVDIVVAGR